jgi:predicted nucleic acid-binding protein
MPEYIFDTTVLSNFASAHRLDLLEGRYRGVVFTTLEVSNELRKGIKAGYSDLKSALQQLAQARDVPLTGTLGILIALVRDDALSLNEANAVLTTMIRRRYRSPVDRLDELV